MTLLARSRGFTLIELLVVIAIIAMLASVILSSLNTARSKGRDTRREADVKELQTSVEQYMSDNAGNPPASISALVPKYIGTEPKDPYNNSSYGFTSGGTNGTHYCIGTKLENAVPPQSAGTCSAATGGASGLGDVPGSGNGTLPYYVGA